MYQPSFKNPIKCVVSVTMSLPLLQAPHMLAPSENKLQPPTDGRCHDKATLWIPPASLHVSNLDSRTRSNRFPAFLDSLQPLPQRPSGPWGLSLCAITLPCCHGIHTHWLPHTMSYLRSRTISNSLCGGETGILFKDKAGCTIFYLVRKVMPQYY